MGASFPELPDENVFTDQTELLLYNQTGLRSSEAREEEARMIAQRMKELLSTGVVLDKGTGEYRPVHYRDMVILTRSLQGWAEVFGVHTGRGGNSGILCEQRRIFRDV